MAKTNAKDNPGGLFIPAGVLVGMGVGIAADNVGAGLFIGLGVGFALMALTVMFYRGSGTV
jgi:hypothetical protein